MDTTTTSLTGTGATLAQNTTNTAAASATPASATAASATVGTEEVKTAGAESGAEKGAEAGKGNVFNELLGHVGDHHEVSFDPIGTLPLPYFFWDADGFHFFGSEKAVEESSNYTVSPSGKALRKDAKPISFDMSITTNLFFMLVASLVLLVALGRAASKAKKSLIPSGFRNMIEVLIVFVRDDIVAGNIEEPWASRLLPYFLTVFFFIMMMNLVGLFPWGHTATSSINVTAALAICTFVVTQAVGIKSMGIKEYLMHFTGGLTEMDLGIALKIALLIIMVPIEIMGLFTKPFALAVRLFANMSAGHIVIGSLIALAFVFHSYAIATFVSIPFALFIYLLEIFVALLQAYVFTMLSAVFIGFMAHTPHEAHEEDHDLHHALGDHIIATRQSV